MFELNLIKDKAKARQRRRIIVVAVSSIVCLAGLCGAFVGSLAFNVYTRAQAEEKIAKERQKLVDDLKGRLDKEEPAARDRKRVMIEQWQEDRKLIGDRVFLTPVLTQLSNHRPASGGHYWLSSVQVTLIAPDVLGGGQQTVSPLQGTRELLASGKVQIVDNDIVTQNELEVVSRRIAESDAFRRAVGTPSFELIFEGTSGGGQGTTQRYVSFTLKTRGGEVGSGAAER